MSTSLQKAPPSKALIIAAFAALYIIWGSTYTAIIIAIRDIPPLLMAGTRFLIAGLLLYIFFRARGEATPPVRSLKHISFSGIIMLFVGTGSVAWVEQYIPSGLAAIIVATTPLWFVLLDKRQWKYNFSHKGILFGLLIGFAGVMTLFADKSSFSFSGDRMKVISFFVLIVGTISWAIGSLYTKYKPMEGSTGMKSSIQMIAAGSMAMIVGVAMGERVNWATVSLEAYMGLLYLIIMGSLVGFTAYTFLLSVRPPSLVGTYAYVNPVVAMFLGWLIANEAISHQQMIALIVILSGVILVNFSKDKKLKHDSTDVARTSADRESTRVSRVSQ